MDKNEEIRQYIEDQIKIARAEIINELREANDACKKFSDRFYIFGDMEVDVSTLEDMIRSLYASVTYAFKNVQTLSGECNAEEDILNHLPSLQ